MGLIARSCWVCGKRTTAGAKCEDCAARSGRLMRSCVTCGKRTVGNYCTAHAEQARKRWDTAFYNDPEYKRARLLAMRRDRFRCLRCGRGKPDGVKLEADHVIPLRDGGTHDVKNLATLCRDCHRQKTAAQRRARRDRR